MRPILLRSALLALLVPLAAGAAIGPWAESAEARARLIGDPGGLGLEFELEPGWHVYWINSGDAGYPPRIDFSATSAVRDARLLFPAPQRFELAAGMVSFGYSHAVVYPIAATLDARPGRPLPIHARLDYLVCRDECIPHTASLSLVLPAAGVVPADAGANRLAAARAALPVPAATAPGAPQVTLSVARRPDGTLTLELAMAGGDWRASSPDLFFESHPFFALARPELSASRTGWRFRVRLQPLDLTKPLPAETTFAWTLTGFERAATAGMSPPTAAFSGTTPVEIPR